MNKENLDELITHVIQNMPNDWIDLTTHRIDKFNESLAKKEFVDEFVKLGKASKSQYQDLPTAFDYIRLGHPLSCVLEWAIASSNKVDVNNVISFSSYTMPIMAVLRRNLLKNIPTRIISVNNLANNLDKELIKSVYGYEFELIEVSSSDDIPTDNFKGRTILLLDMDDLFKVNYDNIDFVINIDHVLGSVIQAISKDSEQYNDEIQHVRRRESIAMTPHNSLTLLKSIVGIDKDQNKDQDESEEVKAKENIGTLHSTISNITSTNTQPILGSCGLSIQYAIMMGLIHHSLDNHPKRKIKFIVPPNCYGGTNDQARRVAACLSHVEIVDLYVDSGKDMVSELSNILDSIASEDAIGFVIAEIPTNPRVEVPDLIKLQEVLGKKRLTDSGEQAIAPVFILDQTFCPNVKFLGEGDYLSKVKALSYVSGSKFPSGGLCTAGYCVANDQAHEYMDYVQKHIKLCSNEATHYQINVLSEQMPSMNNRILKAYENTRSFVDHIEEKLPQAKINFVSQELASSGFTPSVFSLDLPTFGSNDQEREANKRVLNLKLINMMISHIPEDSKYCVSYGQLKGCYWTIPATSTQGTTKEGDKDYIVRVSVSGNMNLELHKEIFTKFCIENYEG